MCPFCLAALAIAAVKVTAAGGVIAYAAGKAGALTKPGTEATDGKENDDGNH